MENKHLPVGTLAMNTGAGYTAVGNQGEPLGSLGSIIEHLPSAVIVTDSTGRLVSYNQMAQGILGKIPENTRPEDWPDRFGFYLKDGKTLYPVKEFPLLRALRGENVEAEEIILLDKSTPRQLWISMNAQPLTSPSGKIDGALVVFNDITASKLLEISRENHFKQIEASYTLSQQISNISNDPLKILNTVVKFCADIIGDACVAALLDSSGNRLKIIASHHHQPSAQAKLFTAVLSNEYRLEGIIASTLLTGEPLFIPTVDELRLKKNALPEQTRYMDEFGVQSLLVVPVKGRNGILGTLSLFRDRGGTPYTVEERTYLMDVAYRTGLAIDTSSLVNSLRMESSVRRIAEEALELSEVRFRTIFTSTALGIKLLDLDGNILETNPAFQNTLGYAEHELRGKPIVNFWHPNDAYLLIQLLDKLKQDRVQSFQLEHRLLARDGSTVWFNVAFTGIKKNERDDSLAFIVAIAENITKRKRIEAEMAEMKSRMHGHVEMERLQLAQELHDGPLQDLYSSIYKLENWNGQLPEDSHEKMEDLKSDLLKVVQELRNTAKNLRPPALTNFGLEKAIRSHAEEFSQSHPELSLHLFLAQDRQVLPEEIRLVLFRVYQHSLANVIRHAQASEVNVHFAFDAEEAELEVSDNGVGFVVPNSWMELVRSGHFGLAGAVERVSLLGGTFTVESTPGQGTTARVVIPIRESMDYTGNE